MPVTLKSLLAIAMLLGATLKEMLSVESVILAVDNSIRTGLTFVGLREAPMGAV